jgi:hypothetical protein
MKKVISIVAIISLVAFGTAVADEKAPPQPKSPGTAAAISLLATAGPVAFGLAAPNSSGALLFLVGAIFGPGCGHLYAGNQGRFWLGAGLRVAGYAACAGAFAASWDNPDATGAAPAFFAGFGLAVASTVIDIAGADDSARKYNRKHGLDNVTVAPTYFPAQNAFGIKVTIRL